MEPHELAAKAADYIEEHGHTKYTLEDWDGRVCISGALILAGGGSIGPRSTVVPPSWSEVMKLVGRHVGLSAAWTVVGWNNAPERTQEEVVAVLREVAGQTVPIGDAHDQMLTG